MQQTTTNRSGALRSRWAAVGAAVAVTLGAGGMVAVNAAPSEPSSFVSIEPTRILDTRSDVGLDGPFVSGEAQTLQVTGTVPTQPPGGAAPVDAAVVGLTATSAVFNVTVVNPQTAGFLSIRPGDATGDPATSNINWGAGGANIANSVTVQLPTAGDINIFVDGTVGHVLIDVAGYNIPGVGASPTPVVESVNEWDSPVPFIGVVSDPVVQAYSSLDFTAPLAGSVSVDWFANVYTFQSADANFVRCVPTLTGIVPPGFEEGFALSGSVGNVSGDSTFAMMSAFKSFPVTEGETITIDLICFATAESVGLPGVGGGISASGLKATFSPAST